MSIFVQLDASQNGSDGRDEEQSTISFDPGQ
jgi:hypothetical protein